MRTSNKILNPATIEPCQKHWLHKTKVYQSEKFLTILLQLKLVLILF